MDYETLLELVKSQSDDNAKVSIISTLSNVQIPASKLLELLGQFSHQHWKLKCLHSIKYKITNMDETIIHDCLLQFPFGIRRMYKMQALSELMNMIKYYKTEYLLKLLRSCKTYFEKKQCIEKVVTKLVDLNNEFVIEILKEFDTEEDREYVLNLLIPFLSKKDRDGLISLLSQYVSDDKLSELKEEKKIEHNFYSNDPNDIFNVLDGLILLEDKNKYATIQILFKRKILKIPSGQKKMIALKLSEYFNESLFFINVCKLLGFDSDTYQPIVTKMIKLDTKLYINNEVHDINKFEVGVTYTYGINKMKIVIDRIKFDVFTFATYYGYGSNASRGICVRGATIRISEQGVSIREKGGNYLKYGTFNRYR